MAEERKKEKSKGFAALGIPVGATLVFKKDPSVTVKTMDDKNKVEYLGKPQSISTLAKQLVGSPVSGYLYFLYEGKILKNLVKKEAASANPGAASPAQGGESVATEDLSAGRNIDPLAGESGEDPAEAPVVGIGGTDFTPCGEKG